MKKIFLVVALALTASVAGAWNNNADEGIVVLASKHLSAEAKSMVNQYLGESFADDVQYLTNLERKKKATHTTEIHYLHLDNRLQPKKVEGDDALATIEEMVAVIRTRDSYPAQTVTKALRILINLVCDIHNFANVRIDGVPHSQTEFSVQCYGGDIGNNLFQSVSFSVETPESTKTICATTKTTVGSNMRQNGISKYKMGEK